MRASAVIAAGLVALLLNLVVSTEADARGRRCRHRCCDSCCYDDNYSCPWPWTCICCPLGGGQCDLCSNVPTCDPNAVACVADPRVRLDCGWGGGQRTATASWQLFMLDGKSQGHGSVRPAHGPVETHWPDVKSHT